MRWGRLLLVVGNLIFLNLLLLSWGGQWDSTEESIHTLSPEIPQILKRLPTKAIVTFVASEGKQAATLKPLVRQIQDILRHFKEASGRKLEIEFVDPYTDPQKRSYVESHFGVVRFPAETADGGRSEVYFSVVVQVGTQSEVLMQNLVRPTLDGNNELNNFESLLVRTLNKLSRRYQTLHQTLIQEGATGKLRIMPVISGMDIQERFARDSVKQRFVSARALIEGVVQDIIDTYPDIRREDADLDDKEFLERLKKANMSPIQLPGEPPFWCHLLLVRADGSSVEVPNIPYVVTARDMRHLIEQYLLLLLDQGGRQLAMLLPTPPADPRGRPQQTGYDFLVPYFQQDFQVHRLSMPLVTIPPGIETLLVMGIARADVDTIREIDKFVMRGGSLILFADRHEFGMPEREAQLFPYDSGFEPVIEGWGLELSKNVGARSPGVEMGWLKKSVLGRHKHFDLEVVRSPYTPVVKAQSKDALPLAGLDGVVMSHPNSIRLKQTRNLKVTPLLSGGEGSWAAVTADKVNPFDLEGNYTTPAKRKWDEGNPLFGVLLEGSFPHYETPNVTEDYVRRQSVETRVALIGDGDFLDINFWAPSWRGRQTQELDSRISDNMMLLRNLVDWAFGDDDVLKVGSRVARIRNLSAESKTTEDKKAHAWWALGTPIGFLLLVGLWRWRRRRIT